MRVILVASLAISIVMPAAAKDVGKLRVTAQYNDRVLVIRNNTGGPLSSCNIYVNSRFERKDIDIPASGREFRWPEFMTRNDVRFDPSLDQVDRIHVLCREGDVALRP